MTQSLDSLARATEKSVLSLLRRKFSHLNDADFQKVRVKVYPPTIIEQFRKVFDPFLAHAHNEAWRNNFFGKSDIIGDQYQTARDMFDLMQFKDVVVIMT